MFDFNPPATAPAPKSADDEEEWAFSSALPESNGLPSSNDITVVNSILLIELHATRTSPSDAAITMTVQFSSKVVQPISELTFQVAVTKVSSPSTTHQSLNHMLNPCFPGFLTSIATTDRPTATAS